VIQLDLVLPDEIWRLVQDKIKQELDGIEYHKVSMTLLDVISGDFFNQYIKIGTLINMLRN
jgi:ribonuclease P/MRP protein subunit RPP40